MDPVSTPTPFSLVRSFDVFIETPTLPHHDGFRLVGASHNREVGGSGSPKEFASGGRVLHPDTGHSRDG